MSEAVKEFKFARGNLMMLPYDPMSGAYKDEALVVIYKRLKSEGLWDIVFHENPDMTLFQFMALFSRPSNLLQIFSIIDGDKIVDIAGVAWLADVVSCQGILNRAEGAFVFFKDYQKPMYTDQFSDIILEYWFEALGMDVIAGVTPETNRAALLYVKRAGFREIGRIPSYTTLSGEIVAGVITCMTKQDYKNLVGG